MDLHSLTIHELQELLAKKEISILELTEDIFKRIENVENNVQSFLTLTKEQALARAKVLDEKLNKGEKLGALAGIPMGVNDNICTAGVKTTCASKMLANFTPPYNATVVEKLESAGAIMVGKTNMDEFGMGSSTEKSTFFPTCNPWNPERVSGGGSAASVAVDEVIFALSSDTGGSIRQPAAFCGVVGLKPTYGTVSRYGLVAYASSLDQIGPFTKDVTDCALVLNVITGHDSFDSTSVPMDYPDYTKSLVNDIKGMRIGIPQEYFGEEIEPGVEAKIKEAIAKLEELGAIVEKCSLPHTEYAAPAYYIISSAEASSNLARYDGVRYGLRVEAEDVVTMFNRSRAQGFGTEVKRRIMLGTYALSSSNYDAYYLKALKVRNLVKQDFDQALAKFDCLLTPTTPNVAFEFGSKADSLSMYKQDICTLPVNLAGLPGLSLPYGLAEGMPVGLQLIGKAFDEGTLLRVAYTLEQNTDETRLKPALRGSKK